jgi:hypothetical protein
MFKQLEQIVEGQKRLNLDHEERNNELQVALSDEQSRYQQGFDKVKECLL